MFFALHNTTLHAADPRSRSRTNSRRSAPNFSARAGSLVVALLLSACANSPHAAVTGTQAAVIPGVANCSESPATRAALRNATEELKGHGMVLKARCQSATGGWVVQVQVNDGVRASKVVRGPLADGHDVDMGTPAGVSLAGAAAAAEGFSPDVQHNRQWLHALMARHQFDNLPDAWWHFAQRGPSPVRAQETDLAAR